MPGFQRIVLLLVRPTEPSHEEADARQRVYKRRRIDSVVPFLADDAVRRVRLRNEHVGERIAPSRARSLWNSARSKSRVKDRGEKAWLENTVKLQYGRMDGFVKGKNEMPKRDATFFFFFFFNVKRFMYTLNTVGVVVSFLFDRASVVQKDIVHRYFFIGI